MPVVPLTARAYILTRVLCVVILVTIVAAAGYSTWIAISNFSRIGV